MTKTIEETIFGALGEASALFMSQECRGVDIVMPDQELKRIGEEILSVLETIQKQTREELVEKIKGEGFKDSDEAGSFRMHADGYNQAIEDIVYLLTKEEE